MNEKTIKFTTKCIDCVFYHPRFMCCDFSRITRFDNQDLVVYEEDHPVIQTLCNYKRDEEWANGKQERYDIDLKEVVKKEAQMSFDFVILSYMDEFPGAKLMRAAKECLKQTILPRVVTFVLKTDKTINFQELFWDLHHEMDQRIEFYIVRITNEEDEPLECINKAVSKLRSMYYVVWETGKDIPRDYNEKINYSINTDLKKISMIHPTEGFHGLTIQTRLHKAFYIPEESIIEIITEKAIEQNLTYMLVNYDEL